MDSAQCITNAALAANSPALKRLLGLLADQPAVLVQIESTQGSVPREAATWMAVFADELIGTIGGGNLEHVAVAHARTKLAATDSILTLHRKRFALGPSLGQCCGGVVNLVFRVVGADDRPQLAAVLQTMRHPVALFGGGHVGHALVQVLEPLPFALTWIDSRDGVFPTPAPANVSCEHSEPVQAELGSLAPRSLVVIMSFSHAEDLDVLAVCLQRQRDFSDLPYIGLIGSRTKWATFRHRLEARGFTAAELAHVTSPIGIAGIDGKEPAVIGVSVAAQLLQFVNASQGS